MRLRNGVDEDPDRVDAVMDLLKTMDKRARVKARAKAAAGTGFVRGWRMTPRLANIIISAVKADGSLQSPYAEGGK